MEYQEPCHKESTAKTKMDHRGNGEGALGGGVEQAAGADPSGAQCARLGRSWNLIARGDCGVYRRWV